MVVGRGVGSLRSLEVLEASLRSLEFTRVVCVCAFAALGLEFDRLCALGMLEWFACAPSLRLALSSMGCVRLGCSSDPRPMRHKPLEAERNAQAPRGRAQHKPLEAERNAQAP